MWNIFKDNNKNQSWKIEITLFITSLKATVADLGDPFNGLSILHDQSYMVLYYIPLTKWLYSYRSYPASPRSTFSKPTIETFGKGKKYIWNWK